MSVETGIYLFQGLRPILRLRVCSRYILGVYTDERCINFSLDSGEIRTNIGQKEAQNG